MKRSVLYSVVLLSFSTFLVQCVATQQDVEYTNVKVRKMDTKVEDINKEIEELKQQTMQSVQSRQAETGEREQARSPGRGHAPKVSHSLVDQPLGQVQPARVAHPVAEGAHAAPRSGPASGQHSRPGKVPGSQEVRCPKKPTTPST